jgi:hypothetical protein
MSSAGSPSSLASTVELDYKSATAIIDNGINDLKRQLPPINPTKPRTNKPPLLKHRKQFTEMRDIQELEDKWNEEEYNEEEYNEYENEEEYNEYENKEEDKRYEDQIRKKRMRQQQKEQQNKKRKQQYNNFFISCDDDMKELSSCDPLHVEIGVYVDVEIYRENLRKLEDEHNEIFDCGRTLHNRKVERAHIDFSIADLEDELRQKKQRKKRLKTLEPFDKIAHKWRKLIQRSLGKYGNQRDD